MNILHVVHCIDTEGPLTEDLDATFMRLYNIFGLKMKPSKDNLIAIQLGQFEHPKRNEIMTVFSKSLLAYNNSWEDIDKMLDVCMSSEFRSKYSDDFGQGWAYSWHCMDHAGYTDNPRRKDLGFGNVFRFYKDKIRETNSERDEINWHFHPLSFDRNPLKAATSYCNSMDVLLDVLCRRVIDEYWFPTVNRPGFHSERPDSHLFLEQWIPYDFANQKYEIDDGQADLVNGRFGDWRRAPSTWSGYNPSHFDYQVKGNCRRKIFRCLNVGTRFNLLKQNHVVEAFEEARSKGGAILSFADHDYRDIIGDVEYVYKLVKSVSNQFPDVCIKFSGACEAARSLEQMENKNHDPIKLKAKIINNRLEVCIEKGKLFGPQPFLAIKSRCGQYFHDNLDVIDFSTKYSYTFDAQTIELSAIEKVAVASADLYGFYDVKVIEL